MHIKIYQSLFDVLSLFVRCYYSHNKVKGLEMEINKMQTQHQKEIADIKKTHQKELIDTSDELKQRFDEEERKIRESYAKDREAAIERERLAIVERYSRACLFLYKTLS